MSKIAVLIPCYNESQTIAKVVRDYKDALPEQIFTFMIITHLMIQIKLLLKQAQ